MLKVNRHQAICFGMHFIETGTIEYIHDLLDSSVELSCTCIHELRKVTNNQNSNVFSFNYLQNIQSNETC